MGKKYPDVLHCIFHSLSVIRRFMTVSAAITLLDFPQKNSVVVPVTAQRTKQDTLRQNILIVKPASAINQLVNSGSRTCGRARSKKNGYSSVLLFFGMTYLSSSRHTPFGTAEAASFERICICNNCTILACSCKAPSSLYNTFLCLCKCAKHMIRHSSSFLLTAAI